MGISSLRYFMENRDAGFCSGANGILHFLWEEGMSWDVGTIGAGRALDM